MARKPDLPCGGGCGKLMWRSRTTAADPKCRDCRRQDGTWYGGNGRGRNSGALCTLPRCARPAQARDMCSTHYSYWYRREVSREWHPRGWISAERRRGIYERDAWTCQICGTPTSRTYTPRDPLAPTLDHIEPVSAVLVPDHSDRNLRTAHALCNAVRKDAALTDSQVRLVVGARPTPGG